MVAENPPAAPSRTPALALEGVGKRYPGADCDALRGIDLEIRDRELVAVVGQSGCGKTTMLRIIAGLEVPDTGTVRIGGKVVAGPGTWVAPEHRGVGMVFQDFALFPHLKVEQNIAYGLNHLPRAARKDRIQRMLELVDLEGLGSRYPHQLSGGQQQRVALARSLAPEPKVLLLDEPFSNLDAPLKASLRDGLTKVIRRTGVPTLLVVHDVEDVVVLANRVAVLREGRIVQQGSPIGLCQNPGDPYTARFFERLRTPDANRFPIEAIEEETGAGTS
ncbi:MAG: ABC transporter ATP-binding protein [Gemmatimonadota bacterium]